MQRSEYVVFDIETGGLRHDAPIIQIAAIACDAETWKELDTFEEKIIVDEEACDDQALSVNCYSRQAWEHAKSLDEVLKAFKTFLGRHATLRRTSGRSGRAYYVARGVGHNATTFDAPRLARAFRRSRLFFPMDLRSLLDTLSGVSWRYAWEGVRPPDSMKLTDLVQLLGLGSVEGAHDALADVRMTAKLAEWILDMPSTSLKNSATGDIETDDPASRQS